MEGLWNLFLAIVGINCKEEASFTESGGEMTGFTPSGQKIWYGDDSSRQSEPSYC